MRHDSVPRDGVHIPSSQALAYGALDAGVQLVTGYPGSPSTETLEALLRLAPPDLHVEWAINEKSAFDTAFGASLAGIRSLLCVKSVGLNVALDSLMVANLAPGPGGFVILTGDDPGGWGSQNEEDSRLLAVAAEVPLLEPTSADDARAVMCEGLGLSERFQVPVVVRITRALASESARLEPEAGPGAPPAPRRAGRPAIFRREADRFNVLPIHVVDMHARLHDVLLRVLAEFEGSRLNGAEGAGRVGIIAAGHAYQKLAAVLAHSLGRPGPPAAGAPAEMPPLRILRLGTLFPLPTQTILSFLREVEEVLVLEELAPLIETQVQALAQRSGLCLPIRGRRTGHLPGSGEVSTPTIVRALRQLVPAWPWPDLGRDQRPMPSRTPLCEDCPYRPAFECLLAVMDRHGGRSAFVVTGETGCMVRAQLPPWGMLDVKYAMGSSIGLATGLALAGLAQRLVALSGDSALLHSGLAELIDAVQAGVRLVVLVLANETTALSGGQPHPATPHDARGHARQPVDLAALIGAAGVRLIRVVDPMDTSATQAALEEALAAPGVSVVIARRPCPVSAHP